jgi:hypothetical protein
MGGMNEIRPTAIRGTMNHAKTSFSTEIFAGAIISAIQYLAPLQYVRSPCPVACLNCVSTESFPNCLVYDSSRALAFLSQRSCAYPQGFQDEGKSVIEGFKVRSERESNMCRGESRVGRLTGRLTPLLEVPQRGC